MQLIKARIIAKPSQFWDYFTWLVYLPFRSDPVQFVQWDSAVKFAVKWMALKRARG